MLETALDLIKEMSTICESNGKSLSFVLGQCCVPTVEAGCEDSEVILHCFHAVWKEKWH